MAIAADAPAATEIGLPTRRLTNRRRAWRRFLRQRLAVIGLVITALLVLVALLAPVLAPSDPNIPDFMQANQFPSREHLMGTDALGREVLSRIIYGLRTSLTVAFSAVAIACLIGIPLGLIAGLRGGVADFVILRVVEVMTAFPGLLFAIFLVAIFGGGVRNVILVIGVTSWVVICRLVRAQLLSLREQDFVLAARSLGAPEQRIAIQHLLPNSLAPLTVAVTLAIPTAIFTEAGLSFLGIGINDPTPSLGKMVAESASSISVYWYLGFYPTLLIALAMLGFTFVGDGLRDALDPRQN
jgi:ABC-type dipeptide/oligopeptide/nickel transport system permease subunit